MHSNRLIVSRNLDERLAALHELVVIGTRRNWVRTIRVALGMSTHELAMRMRVTRSRVSQIERAEKDGSIHLSTLARAAEALNCRVVYFLSPDESLEQMVWRQAFLKASEEIGARQIRKDGEEDMWTPRGGLTFEEEAEGLALSWVGHRWLWR